MTLDDVIACLDAGEEVSERDALAGAIAAVLYGPEPPLCGDDVGETWWYREVRWRHALADSLDDAVAIVPNGWAWTLQRMVETDRPCSASVCVALGPAAMLCGAARADTPTRALVMALLRAHAAMQRIAAGDTPSPAGRPGQGDARDTGERA